MTITVETHEEAATRQRAELRATIQLINNRYLLGIFDKMAAKLRAYEDATRARKKNFGSLSLEAWGRLFNVPRLGMGADAEADDDYRARLLERFRKAE